MNLFAICEKAESKGLPSLLIGGHAVIAHGHARNTFDLDLIIPRSALEAWREFLLPQGYTLHSEGPTFAQFDPPKDQMLPLDLMIVGEETFQRFEGAALPVSETVTGIRMVALKHLLALKSHAIRHGHPGRVEKDVDDVIGLVRVNRINVSDREWREVFLKHGPPELHEKLLRIQ
jgi:hypothetical protein